THGEGRALVAAGAGVLALLVHRVVGELEGRLAVHHEATLRHGDHALHDLHERLLGRHALPHELDGEKGAADLDVRFAASGRPGGTYFVVAVLAGTDDRRVADAAGNLPREPARRRHRADVARGIDGVHVDRAGGVRNAV